MPIETRHILLWLIAMGFLSRDERVQQIESIYGRWRWRIRPWFAFIIFLPIFLMAVFGRVRSDTGLYLKIFRDNVPIGFSSGIQYIVSSSEPGFALFNLLIKSIFGANETIYRLLIALVHTIPVVLILRKYSDDYAYSVFLFVALAFHLSWMMNGLRQFMAVTIIFAATPWMLQKNTIKTILIILFASLFHRSAVFMIPVIFIVRGEIWNTKTILFSSFAAIATFIFAQNIRWFDTVAESMGYSMSFVHEIGDDGTNPLRVMVHAVPMVLSFIFRESLRRDNDPIINLSVNMSVITTGFYLISMVTSGILTGRMPIYTSVYNLILLPYLIHQCFSDNMKKIVFLSSIIFYSVFLYVEAGGL